MQWRILPVIGAVLRRTCTTLGALLLISAAIGMFFASQFKEEGAPSLPSQIVLYLPLDGDLEEMPAPASFADPFAYRQPTVHELVDIIDHAAVDKRVKGIYARIGEGSFALARSGELRAALKRFEKSGKFAYVYSTSYGEGPGGLGRYYLASVFSEIWMQPLGVVSIPGIRAEVPFFRDTLDKVGVQPQFYKRKEYKTAYESATNSSMSAPNREEIGKLVDDIRARILADIPADRGMTPQAFEALVQRGLFTAREAVQAKLITHADYADTLIERIKTDLTGDPETPDESLFVNPVDYARGYEWEDKERSLLNFASSRPSVALIYVVGAIFDTNVGGNPVTGDQIAAADEIAPAILEAADDSTIEAIILRIDSPGGSPVASETILRAIEKAKQKGKPVIVSMGTMAASGGYWIAAYADQIFTMPTTLTGSIGVLGGKLSAGKFWDKVGVNWDKTIQWGQNAGMWSLNTPFSDTEAERMNAMLDNVYESFIARVSKGRGMTPEAVDKIAGGRVWTGERAINVGLADQIGGLHEALNYTAEILGAKDKAGLNVVVLPRPLTPVERFLAMLDESGSVFAGLKLNARAMEKIKPVLDSVSVYGAMPGSMAYEPLRIE